VESIEKIRDGEGNLFDEKGLFDETVWGEILVILNRF
jgi:hypothetical protein